MRPVSKSRWQQMTALVSLSAGGAVTGFSLVPAAAAADLTSPTSTQVHLLALRQAARPAPAPADDAMLRAAIVHVASYYLRMAESKTPAEMEAIIWQQASVNGADHGPSCAAFASLTLEMAAQVVGQQSWVTGGTSYPWPLHSWADVRVDPNPASLGITSVLQDAEAHHRWYPIGDGYMPLPGDWVLFNGHVEVVTSYAGGILHTVGGDSLPNFSVNAHQYPDPLGAQGVVGFVNNGELPGTASKLPRSTARASTGLQAKAAPVGGSAAIPAAPPAGPAAASPNERPKRGRAATYVASAQPAASGQAAIPGMPATARRPAAGGAGSKATSTAPYRRHRPRSAAPPLDDSSVQQSFISEIASGAVAAQRKYGVPAAVTIAQAIDESGWGQSRLASQDHNLFGIKGTGPAGTDAQPTQEYQNGRPVSEIGSFRVYHNVAESIDDHGRLLATSGYYTRAMADSQDPDAFAIALTGVYATDPSYGIKLVGLMRQYDLYRYDIAAPAAATPAALPAAAPPAAAPSAATPSAAAAAAAKPPRRKPRAAAPGEASIPGLPSSRPAPSVSTTPTMPSARATPATGRKLSAQRPAPRDMPVTQSVSAQPLPAAASSRSRRPAARTSRTKTGQYQPRIPPPVRNAFITMARVPLTRAEPLYRDVASHTGIRWEILAACDWMQCEAQPRYSPVHGEKLGTINADGTMYRTRSAALEQCADDLAELAWAVYRIDLTGRVDLSVRDLANVFAAFRWGGLLKLHRTSAMEFPYSVAGLTAQHINMRWPKINDPNTPDKPGGRFRMPFGALPIVLGLNYLATV